MEYEDFLKHIILPDLEEGRPNWDKPHTLIVVEYVKHIIQSTQQLNLDADVLIIAAYAHDWGYVHTFDQAKSIDFLTVARAKKEHMCIGAGKLKKLLTHKVFNFLSVTQKSRAVHLVLNHDNITKLIDTDELVLMEADTLGALNINKIKPTFDKESNTQYMLYAKIVRLNKFISAFGKKEFEKLYKIRENFYKHKS